MLLNNKVKLFVNLYSAFKTPTLYQLYDPSFGNLELNPEESFNIEAGAQIAISKKLSDRGVYFYRNTDDAIEFIITDPSTFASQYRNVSSRKANGVELELDYKSEKWNLLLQTTRTSRERLRSEYDNTGFPTGKVETTNNLYRTPANVFNVNGGVWFGKLYTGATLRVAGERLEPVYGAAPRDT